MDVARARCADPVVLNEANLRRATSDLYYAMFHTICETLTEPLDVNPDNPHFVRRFTNLYRQPDHGSAEHFTAMKSKREQADYAPLAKFSLSEVKYDLATTKARLDAYWAVDQVERAAFATIVGLRNSRANP